MDRSYNTGRRRTRPRSDCPALAYQRRRRSRRRADSAGAASHLRRVLDKGAAGRSLHRARRHRATRHPYHEISASRFDVYISEQPLPLIMTTLFPIGDAYVTIDRETGDVLAEGFHAAVFLSPAPSCPAYCFSRRALRRYLRRDLVTDQHRQLLAPGPADQLCPQSLDAGPAAHELGPLGSRVRDDPTRQRMAGKRHPGPGYNGGVMTLRSRRRTCRPSAREVDHDRAR